MISSLERLGLTLVSVIVLLSVATSGCTPPQKPNYGFNPVLSISEPPVLGKPVKVKLTFTPRKGLETYTVRIILPPGVYEVIQGNVEVSGATAANPSIEATIKSVRTTGSGEIVGEVRGATPIATGSELDYLFISITEEGATVSKTQPKGPSTIPVIKVTSVPSRTTVPAPSGTPSSPRPISPGPPPRPTPGGGARFPQWPKMGLNPVLTIQAAPALGRPVEVTLSFSSPSPEALRRQELYYTARIELPPGVYELVGGELEKKGKFSGGIHTLKATIMSVRPTGSGEIYGRVALRLSPNALWGSSEYDVLFIAIARDAATISKTQPPNNLGGYPVFDAKDSSKLIRIIPYDKVPPRPPDKPLPLPPRTLKPSAIMPAQRGPVNPQTPAPSPGLVSQTGATAGRSAHYAFARPPRVDALALLSDPVRPSVSTGAANAVTASSAILNGNLDSLGTATTVDVSFQWDTVSQVTTGVYANETAAQAMYASGPVSTPLTSLASNTTFFFRAKAASSEGTSYGTEESFVTKKPPLTIEGRFYADISRNVPGQKHLDETKPIVWGHVEVFDTQDNPLGFGFTGSGTGQPYGQNAGEYSITVENPYPLGFEVRISPESGAAVVYSDLLNHRYSVDYSHGPVGYTQSTVTMSDETPSNVSVDYRGAWRIYQTLVNDVYDRGAWNFLVHSARGPHVTPPAATVYYPVDPVNPLGHPPFYDAWISHAIYLDEDNQTKGLDTVQHEYAHFIMHK